MSVQAVSWALQQRIPPVYKLVLIVIADCADPEGRNAFPGQETIAATAMISVRSVRDHIHSLEADGYLRRHRRKRKDGTRTSDEYELIYDRRDRDAQLADIEATDHRQDLPLVEKGQAADQNGDKRQAVAATHKNLTISKNHQNRTPKLRRLGVPDAVQKKKRTQVPENYTLSDALKERLRERFKLSVIERERRRFIGYHRAKGNTWIDHDRAFLNWMDRVESDRSKEQPVTDSFGNEFELIR